jgi:hypothetical protein
MKYLLGEAMWRKQTVRAGRLIAAQTAAGRTPVTLPDLALLIY